MKVRKAGYRIVYNPFATLYLLESKSRAPPAGDLRAAVIGSQGLDETLGAINVNQCGDYE